MEDPSRRFGPDSPEFPAAIAALLLVSLWIEAFLPTGATAVASETAAAAVRTFPPEPGWLLGSAVKNAARAAVVLFAMRATRSLSSSGFERGHLLPSRHDILGAALVAACLLGVSAALTLAFDAAAARIPALSGTAIAHARPGDLRQASAFIGAIAIAALGTGYAEELFFRCFAISALGKAGLAGGGAVLVQALAFGLAHGSQGVRGMMSAAILGGVLGAFRLSGRGPHALSLGHAAYDAAVLAFAAFMT